MNRKLSIATKAILLAIITVLVAGLMYAQTSRGTVSGIITDSTGAVVANAKVTLVQKETNVARETTTNASGLYRFDAVLLGTYEVRVQAAGFAKSVVSGITVNANQTASVDLALKVGKSETTVNVEAGAAAVALQTDDQVRGKNIEATQLQSLPISGLNSLNLMTTTAGIIPSNNGVADSGVGSVNGSRARANNFMIDGTENNDMSVAGPAITMTNNDAIQEVSIQTANFSAEFGRSGGAVVNQITKSGTNRLHGTANFLYDSQFFNASSQTQRNTYFGKLAKLKPGDPEPVLKPVWKEPNFAFTLGGPVKIPGLYDGKDKTFWFVAAQWDRYVAGAAQANFTVPTADGIATLQSLASKCPNAALYLNALGGLYAPVALNNGTASIPISLPTGSTGCDGTDRANMKIPYGTGTRLFDTKQPSNNVLWRIDHTINSKQSIMGRVYLDWALVPKYAVGTSDKFDSDLTSKDALIALTHTYVINSTMTNEFRVNYNRMQYVWSISNDPLAQLPTFAISSLSTFGLSANYPQGRTGNNYQVQDTVTKIVKRHTMRFGLDMNRQIAAQISPFNIRGALGYTSSGSGSSAITGLANFLDDYSGVSSSSRITINFGNPRYHPNYFRHAYFFEDAWKVTNSFTLNAGLRYENFGQPANIFTYPVVSMDASGFTKAKVNPDNNNFGPTVGFAYNPHFNNGLLNKLAGNGKSVIRGGFQVSYDTWFNNLLSNMNAGVPNTLGNLPVYGTTGRGVANLYSQAFATSSVPVALTPMMDASSQFPQNIRNPYTERWSFGIQRELPAGMVLDVSYVGAASHKLFQQQQLNPLGDPIVTATDANGNPIAWKANTARLIPTIGARTIRNASANSNYNGMQTELRKRMGQTPVGGIQFSTAWTWSHNLGVIDEVFATNSSNATMMTANPLKYNGWRLSDYGNSDNDRRHRLVSTVVWDIRGPKAGILGKVLGGWSVSGVIPIQSKTPFTIFNGRDRDFDGSSADRPDIGNWNAPLNTMAVHTTACSSGWSTVYGANAATGCVSPNDVHFLVYDQNTYSPNSPTNTSRRNSNYTKTGTIVANMDIIKRVKINERATFEYRAEIFNIANQQNYNFVPTGTSLDPSTWGSAFQFMDYSQSNAGNRTIRMQVKLIF